jgi:hypothetical protein
VWFSKRNYMADILDAAQSNTPASPVGGQPPSGTTPLSDVPPSPPPPPPEPEPIPPSPAGGTPDPSPEPVNSSELPTTNLDSLIIPPPGESAVPTSSSVPSPPAPEEPKQDEVKSSDKPKKKKGLGILLAGLLLLVITLPILLIFVRQQIEIRSRALVGPYPYPSTTPIITPTPILGSCTTTMGWPGTCTLQSNCNWPALGIAWDSSISTCNIVPGYGCCGDQHTLIGNSCKTTGGWPGTCTTDANCANSQAGIAWDQNVSACGGAGLDSVVGCCGDQHNLIGLSCTTSGGWPGTCKLGSNCPNGQLGIAYDATIRTCGGGNDPYYIVGCCGDQSYFAGKSCSTSSGWPGTCTTDANCANSQPQIAWDATVKACGGNNIYSYYGCCGTIPHFGETCKTTQQWPGTCTFQGGCDIARTDTAWDSTVSPCNASSGLGCCGVSTVPGHSCTTTGGWSGSCNLWGDCCSLYPNCAWDPNVAPCNTLNAYGCCGVKGNTPTPTRPPGNTPTRPPGNTPTRPPGNTPTRPPGNTPTRPPGVLTPTPTPSCPAQGSWYCGGGVGNPPPNPWTCTSGGTYQGECIIYHCPNGCGGSTCGESSPNVSWTFASCSSAGLTGNECGQIDTVDTTHKYCTPSPANILGCPGYYYCDVKLIKCSNCGTAIPTPTRKPTPTPGGPTSTPTPTPTAPMCIALKIYDATGTLVSDPRTLQQGQTVTLAVTPSGPSTKARFSVDGGTSWNETTSKNGNGEYVWNWTIPLNATTFTLEGEIFDGTNWY